MMDSDSVRDMYDKNQDNKDRDDKSFIKSYGKITGVSYMTEEETAEISEQAAKDTEEIL